MIMGKNLLLLAVILICGTVSTHADNVYTVKRISNPDRTERQVDGLMPGGDRENSYTWRLAMRGDYIYIATTRNIASALVNMYAPNFTASGMSLDDFWKLIDALDNGDIPRNDNSEGANIIEYNRKTGDFRVVYTGEPGIYYRMAVTFGDNVYFGSYSANPEAKQYILKLDTDGNFTKVFETQESISLRANCEYDGHLFFAGADDRTEIDEMQLLMDMLAGKVPSYPTKMAVMRKSNDDDTVWERVADYKDFGMVPYDKIMSSWAGCPIWELASHNGYIYATAPSTEGFVIFRGHPAASGETANEYGWYWEEVAGLNNGINNPGLSDVKGGEPGTMHSLIGSVYEFKGQLYAYNFDHSFGGEAAVFAGLMKTLAGLDSKPSDYLEYMYNSLQNPQKVWRLNDETGKFEELTNFTKLMEGTTNEYIWRMGEYDGQLYISTMDAGIFYGYMTQLTNGSLLKMTPEELATKIKYVSDAVELLAKMKIDKDVENLKEIIATISFLLSDYFSSEDEGEEVNSVLKFKELLGTIKLLIQLKIDSMDGESLADKLVLQALQKAKDEIQKLADKIDVEGAKKYLYINHLVRNNEWGFDLFRTSDGETFETITRNGFNDKYNYGCPSFLATDEGLYIGTCNPFYGGQLYLLTNIKEDEKAKIEAVGIEEVQYRLVENAGSDWHDLQGRKINGNPARAGIYLRNGRKVIVQH
jgi:hypothetical protein